MNSFQFGFGNPEGYSDWAKYAGFDRKTGNFAVVPPDQNAPTWDQITERASQVGSELLQGNFVDAFKAYQGIPPKTKQPNTTQPVQESADSTIVYKYNPQW